MTLAVAEALNPNKTIKKHSLIRSLFAQLHFGNIASIWQQGTAVDLIKRQVAALAMRSSSGRELGNDQSQWISEQSGDPRDSSAWLCWPSNVVK